MSQKSLEAPEIIKTIVPDNYQPIYAKKKKKTLKKTLQRDYVKTRKPPPPSSTAQTKQKHCVTQNF